MYKMVLKNDLSGYNAFKLNCHLSYLWFSWTQLSNMISRLLSSFGSGVRKMNRRKYHHHILLVISGFTENHQRKSSKVVNLHNCWNYFTGNVARENYIKSESWKKASWLTECKIWHILVPGLLSPRVWPRIWYNPGSRTEGLSSDDY